MDKEEILKEFDRKVNYENYLNRDEGEIPHEKLRAFIEEAIDQAKLERTEEILKELKAILSIAHKDEVHCTCLEFAIDYLEGGEAHKDNRAYIKELLTKPNQ